MIELKHIAPYLPYGLKATFEGDDCTHEVVGLSIASKGVELISPFGDYGRADIKDCKLILRPICDLTKEIEHNGEKFIPIDELTEGDTVSMSLPDYSSDWNEKNYYSFERYLEEWISGDKYHLNFFPFGFVHKLIEWHFDIYGLIEKGLAVDINDLKEELR